MSRLAKKIVRWGDAQIVLLMRAIGEHYAGDYSTAGLVLSYLHDSPKFYASVCRYPTSGNKIVIVAFRGDSLGAALTGVAEAWLDNVRPEVKSVDALEKMMRGSR